jgi:hypothetical protein
MSHLVAAFFVTVLIAVMPSRWLWSVISAGFGLLVISQLIPRDILTALGTTPRLVFDLFLLISVVASIRLGIGSLHKGSNES